MPKLNSIRILTLAVASATLVAGGATGAFADTRFQQHHPRREEVNQRLAHQSAHIGQERREGEITGRQATALHRDDRRIRGEERLMATRDHGHITRSDQRVLNQRENGVSRTVGE